MGIAVGPPAQPGPITASTNPVCQGASGVIYTVLNDPAVTYTWNYSNPGEATIHFGTSNSITVDFSSSATSGTLSVTTSNSCSTSVPTTFNVTVSPNNTVGPPSSTLPLCTGILMTPVTRATTGATGIGAATGLPPGVTAAWLANTITLSGTPTVGGTYNYSIPLTGGCSIVNATGTIIVNTLPGRPGVIIGNSPVCQGSSQTYTTTAGTGATSHTWTVPAGWVITAGQGTTTITVTAGAPPGGTVSVASNNDCGPNPNPRTLSVTVNSLPTASVPSSTPTLCVNTALTNITHTTTGATGISNDGVSGANGLPSGVSAHWASNTITISGTPTASGTFNYSIPLTGGCGAVNATGTITVTAVPTTSAGSSTPTLCINTVLTNITHTTTGATGISNDGVSGANGLPAEVSAHWALNTITISGTPTASGTFNYSIPLTGGCGTVNATGTINVTAANTAGTPSSSPTLCINTALTNITIATTGATGIGAPVGLPAGVTAAWLANVITISGTPTASGTFNYSIPLTGGCGAVNATGTINVTTANTAGAPSSTPTLCINTALTNITIATTGATGIGAPVGLPAGVTAAWLANVITISGTPTASGTFNYSIPLTGGCGAVNATGTINVTTANTAGAPSSTPTLCINTALTNITIATTGATGIGAPVGLPAGVTAAWLANVITISGTPTASGTFNYSIPLTGGCGAVNATGTINVTTANTAGAPSSTPTLCINTALTNITIATTGATGIGATSRTPGRCNCCMARQCDYYQWHANSQRNF